MTLDFGGSGHPTAPPRRVMYAALALGVGIVVLTVVIVLALVRAAWGGCAIPPPADPLTERRNAVCAALHRQDECELRVRRQIGAHVEATETDYLLYVGGSYLGQFPIVGGAVIDPADLNTELVRRSLLYRMGEGDVQAIVRRLLRGRVVFIAETLDWSMGRADVVIAVGQ